MKLYNWCMAVALFVIGSSTCVRAQEKFTFLSGKVSDADTGQPIPFANIHLKAGSKGTVTNAIGEFIFKIPETGALDTLLISCVGYKTIKRTVQSIKGYANISLQPAVIQLNEVAVNAQTGLDILKKALDKIPENYDTSRYHMTAFYRENIWLGDFELSFNEFVLDILKVFQWNKTMNDQIRILKGRKKKIDFAGKDAQLYWWMSGVSNGARSSLGEDLVKYRTTKNNPFNPRNYKYYNYDYTESIREGNHHLIVIDVFPKKDSRRGIMKLKVFIDEMSMAIIKYNYELTEAGVEYVSRKDKGLGYAIMTQVVHASTDYHRFRGSTTYKEYNKKWYLNNVIRHWEIKVNSSRRNWTDRIWRTDMDFVITDIDTLNTTPIIEGNIGGNANAMTSMVGGEVDEAFWQNYNIVKSVPIDSLKQTPPAPDSVKAPKQFIPNRENGFSREDTLRGKLTPLRTCYDVTFYHLDVAVDMESKSVKGNNLIRFNVKQPFRKMQVDLYANMTINRIMYRDKPLSYTREFNAVFIDFPEELKLGKQSEIKIYYEGTPKTPNWSIPMNGGALWDKDSVGNPWAQMVCQGSGASLWWPNKDHQSDEPDSMKIWITVPSEYTEISNGRLIRKTPMPGNTTRYEWQVTYPINNYNVTFNIGKYAHFTDRYVSTDTLTIDYYVMPYHLDMAKRSFRQVRPMLEAFEKNFGKYPFKRDGFTLMESIYPMEHQSGVCIGKITPENSGDTNPLMWHEVAHEWWGNAITSRDIADMWIHEALATYAEYQVIEHRFGKDTAYQSILDQVGAVRNQEPVIGVYDVNHIYYDIGDMYSKGSLMLHTFRNVLNDDARWTNLLHNIQDHFRYQSISSDELVAYINQQTKTDYTYFFDQYLKYTSLPQLEVRLEEKQTDLVVKYRWHADVSNFRMPLQVTTQRGIYGFIYPTPEWKTAVLKNMKASDFEVDEDRFLIDVTGD